VAVEVAVGVTLGVWVGLAVGLGVAVAVGVAVDDGVGVRLCVADGVSDGSAVGVGMSVSVGLVVGGGGSIRPDPPAEPSGRPPKARTAPAISVAITVTLINRAQVDWARGEGRDSAGAARSARPPLDPSSAACGVAIGPGGSMRTSARGGAVTRRGGAAGAADGGSAEAGSGGASKPIGIGGFLFAPVKTGQNQCRARKQYSAWWPSVTGTGSANFWQRFIAEG
jgi:hypothetical protein